MDRLQKVIAAYGYCSRRQAEKLILDNKVYVNGNLCNSLGQKVSLEDKIIVEGQLLKKTNYVYYCLNKPLGYISTAKDEFERPKITDLVPKQIRVFPVGRLDANTSGVILLTNDGDLCNKLIHPKATIEKVYQAKVLGIVTPTEITRLETGIDIGNYVTRPAKVALLKVDKKANYSVLKITITEGKNRQVRKMMAKIYHPVKELKRLSFANIEVGNLPIGKYRKLSIKEIMMLKDMTK